MRRFFFIILITLFTIITTGCAKDEVVSQTNVSDHATKRVEVVNHHQLAVGEKEHQEVEEEKEEQAEQELSVRSEDITETNKDESTAQSAKENNSKSTKEDRNNTSSKQESKKKNNSDLEDKPVEEKGSETKEEPKEEVQKPKETVTFSITTGDVRGVILSSTEVSVYEGDTVLDVTRRITKEKGIQLSVRGSDATAYVEGIDNLYEFDEGPLSGWLIRVDGVLIDRSTGIYPIEPGQTIKWIYTTNYLEDGFD
ncbi:DUF4430 domain-containing protein [Ornithinibacillus salinisoli]|uniref:DUF4430 domain-containing protein n=1 Tax=Ornithinibacillus salinisoli TaxID=1848459 RepID=A0ABW4VUJ7_9BACI